MQQHLASLAAVVVAAITPAPAAPAGAPAARTGGPAHGTLRQLPGADGCWVASRAHHCAEYRVRSPYEPAGIALDHVATVVVSPDGRNVYAAANPYSNLIAGFTRRADGSLARITRPTGCVVSGSPQCQGPIYRQRELAALAVSPDGRNLYAAADYKYVEAVQAFGRLPDGGLLNAGKAQITCAGAPALLLGTDRQNRCRLATALGSPSDLVVGPGGHELYLAAGSRVVILRRTAGGAIYASSCLGPRGESLRSAVCATARTPGWLTGIALSPDGRNAYVAGSDGVATFARDRRDGSLTQVAGPAGCATEPARDGCACGRALARSWDPARNGGNRVAVSPDGRNVYVTGRYGIAAFARDRRSGELTQLEARSGCIAAPAQAGCTRGRGLRSIERLAISPDGVNVYAASYVSRAVAILRRSASGRLRQFAGTTGCINGDGAEGCARARALGRTTGLAISPDGRNVYVSSYDAGLAIFERRG